MNNNAISAQIIPFISTPRSVGWWGLVALKSQKMLIQQEKIRGLEEGWRNERRKSYIKSSPEYRGADGARRRSRESEAMLGCHKHTIGIK
jgi:hypothetical protein